MLAVEQFGGKRGDKDYIYMDEMLTRNLLKLDTIDTNGKESIRLARKEAIKCIQTSIAVLEAKADLNLNENQNTVDPLNKEHAENKNATEEIATEEKPTEKMDVEEPKADSSNATNEQNAADDATDIPKVENISIDDKSDNEKPSENNDQQTKSNEDSSATAENADAKK